ncbi:hypothetical protein BHAOGJBA_2903 [Methylobacterium hispanicum]|uniref:Uncharacterized protein n=1 Tax=Methylobacterium hispanicum TaxID=270350 RepID=A0AAV4ZLH7_9HYPH|nr:hypothetical protein [Methylobacterium hispanicum]GJD89376.1 hypothetical protein BHAOGJBA_2903 [Methylobacterium hispanicum]
MRNAYVAGFEATSDDLIEVLREAGRDVGFDEADALFETHVAPRLAEVGARAVDGGDDLEAQTGAARLAIGEILKEAGVPADAPRP